MILLDANPVTYIIAVYRISMFWFNIMIISEHFLVSILFFYLQMQH